MNPSAVLPVKQVAYRLPASGIRLFVSLQHIAAIAELAWGVGLVSTAFRAPIGEAGLVRLQLKLL